MPTIRYAAPLQLLVAVRGHPFDRSAFDALFQAMPGVSATMVDQPAATQLMNPDGMAPYDALVLYDMPGLDFDADPRPALVDPGDAFRRGFEALLVQGKGVLALHHAIAGWPAWPGYADLLGGRFRYRPADGAPDSGYRHDVTYVAERIGDHPVLAGVPATFALTDELYLYDAAHNVVPLLRARHRFAADGFHSAAAAMDGRMFDNEGWTRPPGTDLIGWTRPPGTDLIGWTRRAVNSPLVYFQPGDGASAYTDPVYRRLVENAVHWVASPEALLWGRQR